MASTEPRRGEIWLVAFGAARRGDPGKNRPAVVVSVDELATGVEHELFVVVPLSSSLPPSLLRPRVSMDEGVDRDSVVICRAARGVARSRLLRPVGRVAPETLRDIEDTLALVLGLDAMTAR